MAMKMGDSVRVYPQGDAGSAALATVALLSTNQCAIALGFDHVPPFIQSGPLMAVHPEFGVTMLAWRCASSDPWIEMISGRHYEIEEVPVS